MLHQKIAMETSINPQTTPSSPTNVSGRSTPTKNILDLAQELEIKIRDILNRDKI